MKTLVIRQVAQQDYDKNFAYYLTKVGPEVAANFIDAVDAAFNHVVLYPATGSPRYAELVGALPLRSWLITAFPFILLYIEQGDRIEVIRLLHQHADIVAQLQDDIEDDF